MKQKKSSRYTIYLQRPVPNQEITVWKPNQKKRAVGFAEIRPEIKPELNLEWAQTPDRKPSLQTKTKYSRF
jgi:hypothetical protein